MMDVESLPRGPGCYMFKGGSGPIIYVGKAKDIRKRVKSYFRDKEWDPKTEALLRSIAGVDF
ncbi:MAG: nucleotide excision repair endonuclease, partial [Candidatus Hydrothermarchaeaceae archaeon]